MYRSIKLGLGFHRLNVESQRTLQELPFSISQADMDVVVAGSVAYNMVSQAIVSETVKRTRLVCHWCENELLNNDTIISSLRVFRSMHNNSDHEHPHVHQVYDQVCCDLVPSTHYLLTDIP